MSTPPRALVTCGPSVAPIDAVRRITNFSTGELGVRLTESLLENGWEVLCCKGSSATYRQPEGEALQLLRFSTNADLYSLLLALPERETIRVVFHAAALSDYEVASVQTPDGTPLHNDKISSRLPGLQILLQPAPKLLPELGALFPNAKIVGWKFELEGDRDSALAKASQQLRDNQSELCVVNGAAFGTGFGVLDPSGTCQNIPTRGELCHFLCAWAAGLNPL
jgi:phosphopantothenoylcysteine synthetase/decarboxylase